MFLKVNKYSSLPYVAYMVGFPGVDHQDTFLQLCHGQNLQAHSCPSKNIKYKWRNWKENQVEWVVNRNKVPLLDFLFQDTHNPNAIKLHGILIEIFDFCVPPICRLVTEKVWKCGVWPIELEMRRKWNYENWNSPVMINVYWYLSCILYYIILYWYFD